MFIIPIYSNASSFLKSYVFLEEASKAIIKKIDNSDKKRILLIGNKDSGKSVCINYYKGVKNNIDNKIIILDVPSNQITDILESKGILDYYLELTISSLVLNEFNISDKYLIKFIKRQLLEVNDYINNYYVEAPLYEVNFRKGNYLMKILDCLKSNGIRSITCCFDNFDCNTSYILQRSLSDYFLFFDKNIIVVSSDNEKSIWQYKLHYDCDLVEVDYGNKFKVVKKIVDKCLSHQSDELLSINNLLSKKVINSMIEKSNGNFNILFGLINIFYESIGVDALYCFNKEYNDQFMTWLINEKLENFNEFNKIYTKKSKFLL